MTDTLQNSLYDDIEDGEDLNNPSAGGFTRENPEAGIALLRLQSYIEVGMVQPSNKTWKPSIDCIFTFELLHPKHMIEPEGKPAFPMTYTMHVPKSNTVGSRYIKLFNAMNHETLKDGSPRHKNFNTMIGRTPFLGTLTERIVGEGKEQKKYINLTDKDGAWKIGVPEYEADPIGKPGVVTLVPVPEMHQPGKVFLWEQDGWTDEQIKFAWDTLFIEGENDKGKSKNWIQDLISSPKNLDWENSRTRQIVEAGVLDLPADLNDAGNNPAGQDPQKTTPSTEVDSDAAALAALGL